MDHERKAEEFLSKADDAVRAEKGAEAFKYYVEAAVLYGKAGNVFMNEWCKTKALVFMPWARSKDVKRFSQL
jgi:hypothetical protein